MARCSRCGNGDPVTCSCKASITHFFMGDRYRHTWWYCEACAHWTMHNVHEDFETGRDDHFTWGPFPREVGERCVALVAACPAPSDHRCACEAHARLWNGPPREWLPVAAGGAEER